MTAALEARRYGHNYAVYRGSERLTGACSTKELAEGAIERIKRRARRVTRPCMCCGQPFESEGIHNRMCGGCRHLSEVGAV